MEPRLNGVVALLGLVAIGLSLWQLLADTRDLAIEPMAIGETPATLYRPADGDAGPAVVIAHGFAGSQQLMQSFAIALAKNGYRALTYDALGHGLNPNPMTGDIGDPDGASRALLDQLDHPVERARALAPGRPIALVGHSMASDIVVRYAKGHPETVVATVALSLFSPAADVDGPRNLLVLTGAWESDYLKTEALRAVGAGRDEAAEPARIYGSFQDGSARQALFIEGAEHIRVLFARESLEETARWLDQAFGRADGTVETVRRGPWIALLLVGVVLLMRPLASRLPALGGEPLGASLTWRQFLPAALVPAVATPLLLALVPTDFLDLLAGDYLAAHFLAYGLIIAAVLYWLRRRRAEPQPVRPIPSLQLVAVSALVSATLVLAIGLPLDRFVINFWPGDGRGGLLVALLAGTFAYFTADEWLSRGGDAPRGAYWLSKLLFLLSLGAAVALAPSERFTLLILIPVLVPTFLIAGLTSRWCYIRTRHPIPAGIAGALLVGWALGVTFPVMNG